MIINIFYDNTNFRLKNWKQVRSLINEVISNEKHILGDLNFIITNDESVKDINIRFLEHDYYTDVITFNYSQGNIVNGEVYISIDTVRDNANNYKVSLASEVLRVVIHGTLHLLGHDDKTDTERTEMRRLEDRWISYFKGED